MPAPTLAVEPLDLDLVDPHPKNPRRDLGDLTELTASIKTDGVRSPIHVGISTDGQRYVVLAGHRRRAAAIAAGLATIPAVIREDVKTDAAALVEMAVENLLRTDLTPIEEATLFEQLQIAGLKPPAIAKRTGRKRATVDARLALLALPEAARDAVHGAQLSLDDAAALVEFADDEKTVERLTAAAGTHDFRWQLQTARRKREEAAREAATRSALEAAGVPVVDSPGRWWEMDLDRVVDDSVVEGLDDHEARTEARRAAHASCPHHAAYITGGRADYLCLQPDVHATDAPAGSSSSTSTSTKDDAAAAAERAERAEKARQDQEDCETAAGIRRAFVIDTIAGRRGTLSPASCTAIALTAAETHARWEAYCEIDLEAFAPWLEVTLPDELEKATYQQTQAREQAIATTIRTEMGRRGGHVALLALLAEQHESAIKRAQDWEPSAEQMAPGSAGRDWLQLLWELGYEATAWEAQHVAAADTWNAEHPDADDDPDDEA